MSWIKKTQDDKHAVQAWGTDKPGYAERGKTYESDAKALAGKERRELEQLFGKGTANPSPAATTTAAKTTTSTVKTTPSVSSGNVKKLATAGPSAGNHALPSIFRQSADGVTLGSMGSAAFMEKPSLDKSRDINFGSKAAGGTGSGEATKWSMGSANTMERASIDKTRDINFGAKAASGTKKW